MSRRFSVSKQWVPAFAGMTAKLKMIVLSTIALGASGCALSPKSDSLVEQQPNPTFAIQKPSEHFSISGRFSAKRGDTQGSGQFRYEQRGEIRTLELFSPTATQIARIEATAQGAIASLSDGSTRNAATLSELLRQFIDIPITDAEFSSWLQGIARMAPATLDVNGKTESFRESGWTIVVSARFDGDAGLVRRMRWTFDAGGDMTQNAEVRWVFDEFSAQ
jgi:outer membrane biogenesis lipoprotein LolB